MKYFNNINSLAELKARYKKLALLLHPDRGGSTAEFQAMQSEYDNFVLTDPKEQATHTKYGPIFSKLIEDLVTIPNIIVDVVGCWVWISGDTREVKEQIKQAGGEHFTAKWNRTRKIWQIKPSGFRHMKRSSKQYTKDDLQAFYGGEQVAKKEKKQVQAA